MSMLIRSVNPRTPAPCPRRARSCVLLLQQQVRGLVECVVRARVRRNGVAPPVLDGGFAPNMRVLTLLIALLRLGAGEAHIIES